MRVVGVEVGADRVCPFPDYVEPVGELGGQSGHDGGLFFVHFGVVEWVLFFAAFSVVVEAEACADHDAEGYGDAGEVEAERSTEDGGEEAVHYFIPILGSSQLKWPEG